LFKKSLFLKYSFLLLIVTFLLSIQISYSNSFEIVDFAFESKKGKMDYDKNIKNVPDEFKKLYKNIDKNLSRLNKNIDKKWNGKLYPSFIPMASVLPANSNSGESILKTGNREFVRMYVKRLKHLGCKGVQLDIQFPIFDPNYFVFAKNKGLIPQDGPDERDYLNFYKDVVADIRNLELEVSIESQVTFTQETWSSLPVKEYYKQFDKDGKAGFKAYKKRKLEMLQLIAIELKPDYFTICNEPSTEMWLTDIKLLKNKKKYLVN